MPTIEIRQRWTNAVLFSGEYLDLRGAVEAAALIRADLSDADLRYADLRRADLRGAVLRGADLRDAALRGADLRDADLRHADLSGADLRSADLRSADLRGAVLRDGIVLRLSPLQILGLDYPVIIFDNHMQIGCELHLLAEWRAFSGRAIASMDGIRARKFWDAHGAMLLALAASNGRGIEGGEKARRR